jgi:hypothetical protein
MAEDTRPLPHEGQFIYKFFNQAGILDLSEIEFKVNQVLSDPVSENILMDIVLVHNLEFLEEPATAIFDIIRMLNRAC